MSVASFAAPFSLCAKRLHGVQVLKIAGQSMARLPMGIFPTTKQKILSVGFFSIRIQRAGPIPCPDFNLCNR